MIYHKVVKQFWNQIKSFKNFQHFKKLLTQKHKVKPKFGQSFLNKIYSTGVILFVLPKYRYKVVHSVSTV